MSQPNRPDRITLIVVPDETSPVRRMQFPRTLMRNVIWTAALLSLMLTAGLVDWVRLRIDAQDVTRLRAEVAEDRARLTELMESVKGVEDDLARIREFERKVRVIADLPQAMAEASVPLPPPGEADAEQGLPTGPAGGEGSLLDLSDGPVATDGIGLDPDTIAWIQARADHLAMRTHARTESFEDLVTQLEGKSHRLASTPSVWPTDGWVTSRFGYRTSPFTGRRKFHAGLDIAADPGTPVVAPARGKVVYVGRKGALGRTVTLDHGFGIRTLYGHAKEIYVKLGQEVERGDRIAAVGSTGRSTGPHLHYGVSVGGRSVDPSDYILQ